MPTSTRKNGITLIALIITIIVMLILVGVTINVALNGGLFQKVKTAADKTQREADKEELLSAIFGTADNNGNLNIGSLTINGWTKSVAKQDIYNKTYYEFTSAKENKFYVYAETGKILDTEPTQNSNTEAVSEQVQGLAVGDILKYNNENWIVMYNDNTNGLQVVKAEGILYTGTITTKDNNNLYNETIAKASYNNIVKTLTEYCEAQNYRLPGTIATRCAGSPPNYDKTLDTLDIENLYTLSNIVTTNDGLKKATDKSDITVLQILMQGEKFIFPSDSTKILLANRNCDEVITGGITTGAAFSTNYFDLQTLSGKFLYFYFKSTQEEEFEGAIVTAEDKYTIIPVVKLRTDNGFTVTETETVGTFTYSYSE